APRLAARSREAVALEQDVARARRAHVAVLDRLERDAALALERGEEAALPVARAPPESLLEAEARGERLEDLEVGLHVLGSPRRRARGAEEVVSVGAEEVVVLEERRRRQEDARAPGRVGEEGVHDDD